MFDTDLTREYEAACSLGIRPETMFDAGLKGTLCDEATRDRLRAIAESFDWSAVGGEVSSRY